MKLVTVIQARTGSTRLPNKVLRPLLGKPLLVRLVERVEAARLSGTVVVATTTCPEDDPIAELCRQEGFCCFRGHPTDLLDRHYRAGLTFGADAIVKIPSDVPLIDPSIIDRVLGAARVRLASRAAAAAHLDSEGYDYISNLHPATYPDGNDVEVMSMAALETAWREATRPLEREHTTPYLWEHPERFQIYNVTWETGLDYSMTHRWTIDYEEDYRFIAAVFAELYPHNPLFGLADILSLVERRPGIAAINARYAGVNWYRLHLAELKTVTAAQTRADPDPDRPLAVLGTLRAPAGLQPAPHNDGISCIIPFHNEGQRILDVLAVVGRVRGLCQIICVDDGSSDGTAKLIERSADSLVGNGSPLRLVHLPENGGKARAVEAGLKLVASREALQSGTGGYVLLLDADLRSLRAHEIERAIAQVRTDPAADMILLRRVNAGLHSKLVRGDLLFTGERILRATDLARVLDTQPVGYQLEIAINAYMMEHRKRVLWLPSSARNTYKLAKNGLIEGLAQDLEMIQRMLSYGGPRLYVQQFVLFARQGAGRRPAPGLPARLRGAHAPSGANALLRRVSRRTIGGRP